MTWSTGDDGPGTFGSGPGPVDTPDELTPPWLTDALRAGGLAATVERVTHVPVGTGQMSGCYRLGLDYSEGEGPRRLVAKLPSADPQVRQNGAATYVTEVGFYRDIAATVSVRAPRCWYAVGDAARAAFVLLLEDMAPGEPGDQITGCDVGQARAAVVNLAGLHGPRWCDESLRAITNLAPFGADSAEGIGIGFGMTVEPFIERYDTPDADAQVLRAFAPRVAAWITGRADPFALVHGDYRLDNLLFTTDTERPACAAVDWQLVAVGLPARDLGFFLGTGLRAVDRVERERELVAAYHEALVAHGVEGYDVEQCWDDYRYGLFQAPLITVLGAMFAVRTERGDEMFRAMTERGCAAIRETGALELL
jgi:aminoglycoside/choline kinase family phosphotransferase